ncbi:MAG: hypothetical protein ABI352_10535 [Candidatus Dormibacter sp.]
MSVLPVALTWSIGGLLAALLLPRLRHRRRLAALVPLAAAVAAFLTLGGGADLAAVAAPGGLLLGRPAGGLVLVCALSTTVCMVLSPPPDGGEILVVGACGALSAVALATGSPLVWGVCFVGGMALFGVRWVAASPARSTLAAARVGTLSAAVLLAAAPFLPVDIATVLPRAHLAGALLAAGVAAGFGLLPLGGWVTGGARLVRGAALAPWALLLLPALLLSTQPLQNVLPTDARTTVGFLLLPAGAFSAAWSAVQGVLAGRRDRERYPRVLLADLGLVAMGLATPQPGVRIGSLLLLLTHLCTGPLLLQEASPALVRQRRLAWLALSGLPPTPAFWGRFATIAGLTAAFGGALLTVTIPVTAALLLVAFRAATAASSARPAAVAGVATRAAAWTVPLAALTVGLLPDSTLRAFLGVG